MAKLQWDRLLETCVKRGDHCLLVPGHQPFLRLDDDLRALEAPPLSPAEIRSMADDFLSDVPKQRPIPGLAQIDFRYGTEYRFRMAIVGSSAPSAIMLTRIALDDPPFLDGSKRWSDATTSMAWAGLIPAVDKASPADAIVLAPGCPPLVWSWRGVHAFSAPVLTPTDLANVLAPILPPPEHIWEKDGYRGFEFRHGTGALLEAWVLGSPGGPGVELVLVMRRPDPSEEGAL